MVTDYLTKNWRGIPRYYYFFFILIILFRLIYSSMFVSFGQDVARDAYLANRNIESKHYVVAYGPKASVWNFYLPPFYYQLHLIVSMLFQQNPLAMKWFITLAEAMTPIVVFFLLTKLTKPAPALLAASLYAFSPAVIFYATNAWNPNMIPLLSVLMLYCLILHFKSDHKWAIVWTVTCLGIALHLHYQSTVLIPFVLLAGVKSILNNRQNAKYWLIGILICLISMLPYVYAETQNQFHNTKNMIEFFTLEHSNYYDRVSKPAYLVSFIPGYFERTIRGIHTDYWLGRMIIGLGVLSLLGLSFKKNKAALWTLLYFLSVLIMLRLYKGDKVDYYLHTLMFMPFVFMGLIIDRIKVSAILFCLLIVLYSAPIFAKQKPFNDLISLQLKMNSLLDFVDSDQISLLFHDDDQINVYAYGITYLSKYQVDQNSSNLLEICRPGIACAYDGYFWCKPDSAYMYMADLKRKMAFQQTAFQMDNQSFVFTHFNDPGSGLLPQPKNSGYGSDFIFQNATIN